MGPTALRIAGIETMLTELGHRVTDDGDLQSGPGRAICRTIRRHTI